MKRGLKVPSFIRNNEMISEQQILSILESKEFEKYFFVSVKVSGDNKITIAADIDECGKISTKLEEALNRDQEDFELEVSSPGLTEPFKVLRQYTKNIGKTVDITLADGNKIDGVLLSADNDGITIKQTVVEKINGKRKKSEVDNTINFAAIKTTKLKIKI